MKLLFVFVLSILSLASFAEELGIPNLTTANVIICRAETTYIEVNLANQQLITWSKPADIEYTIQDLTLNTSANTVTFRANNRSYLLRIENIRGHEIVFLDNITEATSASLTCNIFE